MPKEEPHLEPLRKQRKERRQQFLNHVPSTVYFQVIGHGTPGGPRSLFMYTENVKFLFNCGEGTQRLCMEYCGGRTLAELAHIFITRKSWDNLGGLPGMYLSIRSAGSPDVTIHGPKGTIDIYHGLKSFIASIDFDVMKHDSSDPTFDTAAFTIKHVDIPLSEDGKKVFPSELLFSKWSSTTKNGDDETDTFDPYDATVTAYVVTCKPKPGKLLVQKCKQLGVQPGPAMGKLKAGKDVVLEDGTIVKSKDVMEEELPPQSYIVIEIPTLSHLSTLMAEEHLQYSDDLANTKAIFHFSPPDIMKNAQYISWMKSFPM